MKKISRTFVGEVFAAELLLEATILQTFVTVHRQEIVLVFGGNATSVPLPHDLLSAVVHNKTIFAVTDQFSLLAYEIHEATLTEKLCLNFVEEPAVRAAFIDGTMYNSEPCPSATAGGKILCRTTERGVSVIFEIVPALFVYLSLHTLDVSTAEEKNISQGEARTVLAPLAFLCDPAGLKEAEAAVSPESEEILMTCECMAHKGDSTLVSKGILPMSASVEASNTGIYSVDLASSYCLDYFKCISANRLLSKIAVADWSFDFETSVWEFLQVSKRQVCSVQQTEPGKLVRLYSDRSTCLSVKRSEVTNLPYNSLGIIKCHVDGTDLTVFLAPQSLVVLTKRNRLAITLHADLSTCQPRKGMHPSYLSLLQVVTGDWLIKGTATSANSGQYVVCYPVRSTLSLSMVTDLRDNMLFIKLDQPNGAILVVDLHKLIASNAVELEILEIKHECTEDRINAFNTRTAFRQRIHSYMTKHLGISRELSPTIENRVQCTFDEFLSLQTAAVGYTIGKALTVAESYNDLSIEVGGGGNLTVLDNQSFYSKAWSLSSKLTVSTVCGKAFSVNFCRDCAVLHVALVGGEELQLLVLFSGMECPRNLMFANVYSVCSLDDLPDSRICELDTSVRTIDVVAHNSFIFQITETKINAYAANRDDERISIELYDSWVISEELSSSDIAISSACLLFRDSKYLEIVLNHGSDEVTVAQLSYDKNYTMSLKKTTVAQSSQLTSQLMMNRPIRAQSPVVSLRSEYLLVNLNGSNLGASMMLSELCVSVTKLKQGGGIIGEDRILAVPSSNSLEDRVKHADTVGEDEGISAGQSFNAIQSGAFSLTQISETHFLLADRKSQDLYILSVDTEYLYVNLIRNAQSPMICDLLSACGPIYRLGSMRIGNVEGYVIRILAEERWELFMYKSSDNFWYTNVIDNPAPVSVCDGRIFYVAKGILYIANTLCDFVRKGFCYSERISIESSGDVMMAEETAAVDDLDTAVDSDCVPFSLSNVSQAGEVVCAVMTRESEYKIDGLCEKLKFDEADMSISDILLAGQRWRLSANAEILHDVMPPNDLSGTALPSANGIGDQVAEQVIVSYAGNKLVDTYALNPFEYAASLVTISNDTHHFIAVGTGSCLNGGIPEVGRLIILPLTAAGKFLMPNIFVIPHVHPVCNIIPLLGGDFLAYTNGRKIMVRETNFAAGNELTPVKVQAGTVHHVHDFIVDMKVTEGNTLIVSLLTQGISLIRFENNKELLLPFMGASNCQFCALIPIASSKYLINNSIPATSAYGMNDVSGKSYVVCADNVGNILVFSLAIEHSFLRSSCMNLEACWRLSNQRVRLLKGLDAMNLYIVYENGLMVNFSFGARKNETQPRATNSPFIHALST